MVKFKKIFAAGIAVFALILCGLFQSVSIAYAASEQVISGGDGTYTVPVNLDLKMGADNFTNPVTVEKQDGKYYMTFGFSSSIGYLNLNLDVLYLYAFRKQSEKQTFVFGVHKRDVA